MNRKDKQTKNLLQAYSESSSDEIRGSLAEKYEIDAKNSNYKRDYVAVNHHSGSSIIPVFNKLMQIAELRTFEIQEYDYKDRFSVFSRLGEKYSTSSSKNRIDATISNFNNAFTNFPDKMKYLCDQRSILDETEFNIILSLIPDDYRNYLTIFTVKEIKSKEYRKLDLEKEFKIRYENQYIKPKITKEITATFITGSKYTKSEIKEKLGKIYKNLGYNSTPKATDLEQWFEIKSTTIKNQSGKWVNGIEIIKKKGD